MSTVALSRKFSDQTDIIYDRSYVGGGLAMHFAMHHALKLARHTKQPWNAVMFAPEFKSPCAAGNQMDLRIEGLLDADAIHDPRYRSLLQGSKRMIEHVIRRTAGASRFNLGYEVQGKKRKDFDDARRLMIGTGVERAEDITEQTQDERVIPLPGFKYSASVHGMGQLNVGEFLTALRKEIVEMGGTIKEGCSYLGQSRNAQGRYVIHTDGGDFISRNKPLLGTGAEHISSLPEIRPIVGSVRYTMGVVIGPLSEEDARRVAKRPMSFSDTEFDERHDILWGGLDPKNFLTVGWGELDEKTDAQREALQHKIFREMDRLWPALREKYMDTMHVSFGPMLRAHNEVPIVGRLKDYDVCGGWGGFGIVAGFAAGRAWAKADILGDDRRLKFFEWMQPQLFKKLEAHPDAEPVIAPVRELVG